MARSTTIARCALAVPLAVPLVALCARATAAQEPGTRWRYVSPDRADRDVPPPLLRALATSDAAPDGVSVVLPGDPRERRFAQVRFGSAGSARVAVALDTRDDGVLDLYVDRDRDRQLDAGDRVEGTGPVWRVPLQTEQIDGEDVRHLDREVAFRVGRTGAVLGYAATGYAEGSVVLAGEPVPARLIDGDGDGSFLGERDRLLLDLDRDGSFDAVRERFATRPVLTIGENRYAVRADGDCGVDLERIEGTGRAALSVGSIGAGAAAAAVLEAIVTLVSRDGLTASLRATGEPIEVPVGEYRITNLKLALADPQGGQPWNYVFSTSGGRGEPQWHAVERDAVTEIDPVGELEFVTTTGRGGEPTCHAGESLPVETRLYTGSGLLINTCYRGATEGWGGPAATIALTATDAEVALATTTSGFA